MNVAGDAAGMSVFAQLEIHPETIRCLMLTALDVPSETLDEAERRFVAKVREHGWFRTEIHGEDGFPGFSFTTGFWVNVAQPELIMFSMNGDITHDVFWDLFRDAKASKALPIGRRTNEVFSNLPAYVFPVAKQHYREHLGWSRWFYGGTDDFSCSQIVWPDPAGVFPWEAGFDCSFEGDQPDLTERGWKASVVD